MEREIDTTRRLRRGDREAERQKEWQKDRERGRNTEKQIDRVTK